MLLNGTRSSYCLLEKSLGWSSCEVVIRRKCGIGECVTDRLSGGLC